MINHLGGAKAASRWSKHAATNLKARLSYQENQLNIIGRTQKLKADLDLRYSTEKDKIELLLNPDQRLSLDA